MQFASNLKQEITPPRHGGNDLPTMFNQPLSSRSSQTSIWRYLVTATDWVKPGPDIGTGCRYTIFILPPNTLKVFKRSNLKLWPTQLKHSQAVFINLMSDTYTRLITLFAILRICLKEISWALKISANSKTWPFEFEPGLRSVISFWIIFWLAKTKSILYSLVLPNGYHSLTNDTDEIHTTLVWPAPDP